MQCAVTMNADGTQGDTCTTADCTFVAGASPGDMISALQATTEGEAWMACQNPPEPCPNDASRDGSAVMSACMSDADCLAIITADDFAAGDEPTQAEVLASGCGANAECCAIVTCQTAHSCTGASPAPAADASGAARVAPAVMLAFAAIMAN